MAFRVMSGDLAGLRGRPVEVEADLVPALNSFVITGLPGPGIRESRQRIRSAIENSGYRFPDRHRIVVHLAPASVMKDGSTFDLAIALAILVESGQIPAKAVEDHGFIGELALDGRLRPVRGGVSIAQKLQRTLALSAKMHSSAETGKKGKKRAEWPHDESSTDESATDESSTDEPANRTTEDLLQQGEAKWDSCANLSRRLFVPQGQHPQGQHPQGAIPQWESEEGRKETSDRRCEVVESESLLAVLQVLSGQRDPNWRDPAPLEVRDPDPAGFAELVTKDLPDMSDVLGQHRARRALEICAAGEHPLIFVGPPGCGKSLLARRLPGLLPKLDVASQIEVGQIRELVDGVSYQFSSIAASSISALRPFRAPHHSITVAGLVGGGTPVLPGEISRAHRGVLFLDELPEISQAALEALREPLEEGVVTISRASGSLTFPGDFLLVAAMNPCPCGQGDQGRCRCLSRDRRRYERRLSDPLLDRFDLHVALKREKVSLFSEGSEIPAESTEEIRQRVELARIRMAQRGGGGANRKLRWQNRERWLLPTSAANDLLRQTEKEHSWSMRGWLRFLRVSRTIADLAASDWIHVEHLLEALTLKGPKISDS